MPNIIKMRGKKNIFTLIVCIFIPELVGLLSGFLTKDAYGKYQNLIQPKFAPPPWVFGVVWPILFFLMGIASYRIWMLKSEKARGKNALFYYGLQLFFNFFWSILFFGLALRGLALIELLILLILIIITCIKFYRLDKVAGYLFIPYIVWVAFAGILNLSILWLNK
ncbi:TspO/MBR family protein [Marinisporobacter balticus]|uniref:TspO/MBR related protein n=1 Tax=Marinisporobacter balticus TaxID=2018667 RepID=A0A4V2SC83_9FIRM|nr:TspO/MBR family protein [Marinisporobacter balticus]TCO78030.1 TspO/MBR related protein [Marinisporobacter balticus]